MLHLKLLQRAWCFPFPPLEKRGAASQPRASALGADPLPSPTSSLGCSWLCFAANLVHKKSKVKPDPKCNSWALLGEQAHALASTGAAGGCQAPAPDVAFVLLISERGESCRAVGSMEPCLQRRWQWQPPCHACCLGRAGLSCGCGGCCSGGRGASSRGLVLVTSLLQRLLESRNKIRSRLR